MTRPIVFVLEDHPARLAEMLAVLRDVLPDWEVHVEDDCKKAIEWFKEHQGNVGLISLDHDLDSAPRNEEHPIDHGCGRGVADHLALAAPTCPVIVHTSNADAGDGMFYELQRANWPVFRVYPYDEHRWVSIGWKDMVKHLLSSGWIARS